MTYWFRTLAKCGLIVAAVSLAGVTTVVSPALAQRQGGVAGIAGVRPVGRHGGPVGRLVGVRRGRRVSGGYEYAPNYYPFRDSEDRVEEPPPPQIIVQTATPAAPAPATVSAPKPPESLVVELRGDHWVRLTGYGASEIAGQIRSTDQQSVEQQSESVVRPQAGRTPVARALPPAVLVFRDGHQEEAARYTIIGKTIAIKTDYWTSGSWTRRVAIAELDVSATLKANQERGAKFYLPSRLGEVVMRP
jgi:hypothetical protein